MHSNRLLQLRLSEPNATLPPSRSVTLATIARLVASAKCQSKADLASATGLARTTVTTSVNQLMARGFLEEAGPLAHSGRGRPASGLRIANNAGHVLVFDCGVNGARLAIVDLSFRILAERVYPIDLPEGPEPASAKLIAAMQELLSEVSTDAAARCVVVGLPLRLDYSTGSSVRPAQLPTWDGYKIQQPFRKAFNCDVLIENDANLRALGESRALPEGQLPLLTLKVGTGIGAGMVSENGSLHRGSVGASGEIGHVSLRGAPDTLCACGRRACLEAVASTPVLLRQYAEARGSQGPVPTTSTELAALVRERDPLSLNLLRQSAIYIGEALANLVNIFNPARVIITGEVVAVSDELLARVRSMVYEEARPHATRDLHVSFSSLGPRAGIAGAAVLGTEHLLSPEQLT